MELRIGVWFHKSGTGRCKTLPKPWKQENPQINDLPHHWHEFCIPHYQHIFFLTNWIKYFAFIVSEKLLSECSSAIVLVSMLRTCHCYDSEQLWAVCCMRVICKWTLVILRHSCLILNCAFTCAPETLKGKSLCFEIRLQERQNGLGAAEMGFRYRMTGLFLFLAGTAAGFEPWLSQIVGLYNLARTPLLKLCHIFWLSSISTN
jgi:hypothetical protein